MNPSVSKVNARHQTYPSAENIAAGFSYVAMFASETRNNIKECKVRQRDLGLLNI
jgi:hypothetical protein